MKMIIIGLLFTIGTGAAWPSFSILYGHVFKILKNEPNYKEINSIINSIGFCVLGVIAGFSCFGASAILAIVGENLTMRMRLLVFKVILKNI